MKRLIFFVAGGLLAGGLLVGLRITQKSHIDLSKIELADTREEHARGLMNRTDLCESCGMLFVFDKPTKDSFWMKDTLLPLDIVMIEASGKIVTIHRSAKPYSAKLLPSAREYQYALEVNAGKAANLNEGNKLDINYLKSIAQ